MGSVDLNKIEELSSWYTSGEGFIDFDGVLQLLRYRSIKPYFKGTRCLEIAPAQGITTAKLKDDFASLDIVDGSQKLLDVIPDYPGMRKFRSMIEGFEPDTLYDTIIMDHLLEHLEFPIPALERIKGWLKPDGVLIVGVPNGKSFHRMLGVKMGMLDSIYSFNDRDRDLGHFRIYDLDTLQADAVKAGLKVLHTEGVFFKILSNKQLGENFSMDVVEGFYELGKEFKEHCAEIYVICTRND